MGTLRSLGALARALGPTVAASGEGCATALGACWAPGEAPPGQGTAGPSWRPHSPCWPPRSQPLNPHPHPRLNPAVLWGGDRRHHHPAVSAAYWLAGARVCYTVCAGLFLLPFSLLRKLRPPAGTLKAE